MIHDIFTYFKTLSCSDISVFGSGGGLKLSTSSSAPGSLTTTGGLTGALTGGLASTASKPGFSLGGQKTTGTALSTNTSTTA